MKKIEAIIRVEKLASVKQALEESGYPGMTTYRIQGHGRQKGITQQFRGRSYKVDLLPKMKLEIVAHAEEVATIIDTIVSVAQTGEIGDGKIFVSTIEETVRIRTGEKGTSAL